MLFPHLKQLINISLSNVSCFLVGKIFIEIFLNKKKLKPLFINFQHLQKY